MYLLTFSCTNYFLNKAATAILLYFFCALCLWNMSMYARLTHDDAYVCMKHTATSTDKIHKIAYKYEENTCGYFVRHVFVWWETCLLYTYEIVLLRKCVATGNERIQFSTLRFFCSKIRRKILPLPLAHGIIYANESRTQDVE